MLKWGMPFETEQFDPDVDPEFALTRDYRFALAYISDPKHNVTDAAVIAGYPKSLAKHHGTMALRDPRVKSMISRHLRAAQIRTEITVDRVMAELGKMAFSNMMDYIKVQADGSAYVDLSQLTREQAACISEIVTEEYTEGRGEDAREVKKTRVKLHSKQSALAELGKYLGIAQKLEITDRRDSAPKPATVIFVDADPKLASPALSHSSLSQPDGRLPTGGEGQQSPRASEEP